MFPLAEWLILALTVLAWAESHRFKKLGLTLILVWVIGKYLEGIWVWLQRWHIYYSRLLVAAVFCLYAFTRAKRHVLPLIFTSLTFLGQNLFLVNEPGIVPMEQLVFSLIIFIVAWFTAQEYWSMAFAISGSVLLNQLFVFFCFGGIVRHLDFPDPFLWHFSASFLVISGIFNFVLSKRVVKAPSKQSEEQNEGYLGEADLLEKGTDELGPIIE